MLQANLDIKQDSCTPWSVEGRCEFAGTGSSVDVRKRQVESTPIREVAPRYIATADRRSLRIAANNDVRCLTSFYDAFQPCCKGGAAALAVTTGGEQAAASGS
jgi:hypothetical protein